MRETLYLRLRELSPDAPTVHAITGPEPGPSIFVREAPLSEAIEQGRGRRVVLFVSGADVRLTQVKVPARQPAKVLQAAPFVLEDQFAEDIETLHFALGTRQPDGAFPIAVVAHERMEQWLAPFRKADVAVHVVVPETFALPWDDTVWPLLVEPHQLTARTGIAAGFSCVPEDLDLYLDLAGGTVAGAEARPLRMLLTRGAAQDFTRLQRPVELAPGFADPLEALVRHLNLPRAINLLQGIYSQREEFERFWRPWRFAVAAAVALFVLGVALNLAQALRLGHAAKEQDIANDARYHQLFPAEKSNVNLFSLIEQKEQIQRTAPGAGGLLFLMQQAAQALAATPGLTLKTLQFRDGALFLDLSGSDVQAMEKLGAWFGAHPGAKLERQSLNAGENEVQARFKLSAAA